MVLSLSKEHQAEYAELAKFYGLEDARDALLHGIAVLKALRKAQESDFGIMLVPQHQTQAALALGAIEPNIWR